MAADRTLSRGGRGGDYPATVEAGPLHFHVRKEQLAFLQQVSEFSEPVSVSLLYPRDILK